MNTIAESTRAMTRTRGVFRPQLRALVLMMAAIALVFPFKSNAQSKSITASLSGTVTDPSGARIPKATAKLTNPENGIIRTSTTTETGEFTFAFLPEGTYTLEVSAPGFKTTQQNGIVLTAGTSQSVGITLTLGATEQVIVNSAGPLLQTTNANISTELTNKQIQELPLNLRNVLSFATLDSAVNVQGDRQLLAAGGSEDTADQDYSFMNFGGGYFGTNLFILEGGYATRTWTQTFTSTTWLARPDRMTIATSSESPAAGLCTSQASTSNAIKRSFLPTMRVCVSTAASPTARRCPPQLS